MNGTAARLVRGYREWRRHTWIKRSLIPNKSAIPRNPCSSKVISRHWKRYCAALCPIPAISLEGEDMSIGISNWISNAGFEFDFRDLGLSFESPSIEVGMKTCVGCVPAQRLSETGIVDLGNMQAKRQFLVNNCHRSI